MITTGISGTQSLTNGPESISENEKVSIEQLAKLTGFPEDFIKNELLIRSDAITLKSLRKNMLNYLERINLEN